MSQRLPDSPSRGVVFFRLWISSRIWSQNRNGSKGRWGTNLCIHPRKCPFKVKTNLRNIMYIRGFSKLIFEKWWIYAFTPENVPLRWKQIWEILCILEVSSKYLLTHSYSNTILRFSQLPSNGFLWTGNTYLRAPWNNGPGPIGLKNLSNKPKGKQRRPPSNLATSSNKYNFCHMFSP